MDYLTSFYLIPVVILIAISAVFSCGETLMTSVSRAKIHRLASEGDKRAKRLEKLLMQREKVLSAMLVGNNIVNIIASVLTTSVLITIFGEVGVVYATIAMTILVIIFSEIAPKTLALKSPVKLALFLAPFLFFTVKILYPLTSISQGIVNGVINIFCPKPKKKSKEAELEEIRETLEFKHKEGSLFKYDKDLLDGVLDLSDTAISEIMVHRKEIESINANLPIAEIVAAALKISYTRIPLWRGNKENIVAILNVRKLLKGLHASRIKGISDSKFELSSATSQPWFVPSTNTLRSLLFAFRNKKKRFALVVDEYGSLLGLVTLEDILEEIVGEIKEQDDNSEINIIKVKSGAYKITGKTLIRDINRKLDWELPEDDHAYNIAAFVINNLGRIPDEKETFLIDGFFFEILKKKNQDLILIKVKKINSTN